MLRTHAPTCSLVLNVMADASSVAQLRDELGPELDELRKLGRDKPSEPNPPKSEDIGSCARSQCGPPR